MVEEDLEKAQVYLLSQGLRSMEGMEGMWLHISGMCRGRACVQMTN